MKTRPTIPLYDILDESGNRLYKNMADDSQCQMYYWPDSNGFIRYDQIDSNHWQVIESGYYEMHCNVTG